MKTSNETLEIFKALHGLSSKVRNLVRDTENTFFRSKYVPLDKVLDVIRDPLHEWELVLNASPTQKNGTVWVETRLTHMPSGQFVSVCPSAPVVPQKLSKGSEETHITPQAVGAAITYLRRYGLMALLGLAETDDDGSLASGTPLDKRPSWIGPLSEEELTAELRKVWRSVDTSKDLKHLDQVLWQHQEVIEQCKVDLKHRWDGSDGIRGLFDLIEGRKKLLKDHEDAATRDETAREQTRQQLEEQLRTPE